MKVPKPIENREKVTVKGVEGGGAAKRERKSWVEEGLGRAEVVL